MKFNYIPWNTKKIYSGYKNGKKTAPRWRWNANATLKITYIPAVIWNCNVIKASSRNNLFQFCRVCVYSLMSSFTAAIKLRWHGLKSNRAIKNENIASVAIVTITATTTKTMTLTTNYNTKLEYFIPAEYIYVDIGYVCIWCMYVMYLYVYARSVCMYVCVQGLSLCTQ